MMITLGLKYLSKLIVRLQLRLMLFKRVFKPHIAVIL
jgi:hypothetical protein